MTISTGYSFVVSRTVFFTLLLLAFTWSIGTPLNAQIYVGVQAGANGGVSEYDANTGAAISTPLISGSLNPNRGIVVSSGNLYLTDASSHSIGLWSASTGLAINSAFITGLNIPEQIAIQANVLYVADAGNLINSPGAVHTYNATTGALLNFNFIATGDPLGLAVAGNHLFVANYYTSVVSEYDASTGAAINLNFITGLGGPNSLAIDNNNLYVANLNTSSIGEYDATTGAAINANLVANLSSPTAITVASGELFVGNTSSGEIGEYDASTGAPINPALITVPHYSTGIFVLPQAVPEPGTVGLLLFGVVAFSWKCRRHRQ